MAGEGASVLVVDDEECAHELMRLPFERLWRIRQAYNVAQALNTIRGLEASGEHMIAAIVDLKMPGGTGLDVLEAARRAFPQAFLVLSTGFLLSDVEVSLLNGLRAYCCEKDLVTLRAASLRVLGTSLELSVAIIEQIETLARETRLSQGEIELLTLACGGVLVRDHLADRLGVELSTIKTKISSLLYKVGSRTGDGTLRGLVWSVFHDAMSRSSN